MQQAGGENGVQTMWKGIPKREILAQSQHELLQQTAGSEADAEVQALLQSLFQRAWAEEPQRAAHAGAAEGLHVPMQSVRRQIQFAQRLVRPHEATCQDKKQE